MKIPLVATNSMMTPLGRMYQHGRVGPLWDRLVA